jgi:hypothetical protein
LKAILLKYLQINFSFGNYQARIVFPEKLKSNGRSSIAKLQVINPFDYFVEEYADFLLHMTMLQQELTAY